MWRHSLECFGYSLIFNGLLVIGLTAILAFSRGDDPKATFEAFLGIYAFALALIYAGFRLLRSLGVWPPKDGQ